MGGGAYVGIINWLPMIMKIKSIVIIPLLDGSSKIHPKTAVLALFNYKATKVPENGEKFHNHQKSIDPLFEP